jgi:acetolactate synthase-1/3 small subunit
MLHLFTISAEDKPGVLARITGLLGARGENITRISAHPAARKGAATITAVVEMSEQHAEFVRRKILKLVAVLDVTTELHVEATTVTISESLWPPGPRRVPANANHPLPEVAHGS